MGIGDGYNTCNDKGFRTVNKSGINGNETKNLRIAIVEIVVKVVIGCYFRLRRRRHCCHRHS